MKRRLTLSVFLISGLGAHPMGNFSVSHYSRIQVRPQGVAIHYVLDLAEIPTFQLLQEWKLDGQSPRTALEQRAVEQAKECIKELRIATGGRRLTLEFERASLVLDKGAGGLPIVRISADLQADCAPGRLTYVDGNYPDRAGWKEIVIAAGEGAIIRSASPAGADRSDELRAYPVDPQVAPPQDLRAVVEWRPAVPLITEAAPAPITLKADVAAQQPGQRGPGAVRGDFLSRLLHQGEIPFRMVLVGIAVAFGLGAIHAMSPGHGKTIVAAYLVGSRGTPKHAIFLGAMVTFTHTVTVFLLGIATLFLSRYVVPEKIYPVLGTVSGLSIVWIGAMLLYKRIQAARNYGHSHHHAHAHAHAHAHGHHHDHAHDHPHDHVHDHPHDHEHAPGALVHDHGDGHVHSHVPDGDVSMGSLIALGASGGLVPCPSALVLLLSAIALGRVGLGLGLLVAFSLGLAGVLMAIGVMVLYAKHLLPDRERTSQHAVFRLLPVASAAIIVCVGLIMTGVSAGWIRPEGFLAGV